MTNEHELAIEPEVDALIERAPSWLLIETTEQAQQVADYMNDVRANRKRIAEFFKDDIDRAHKMHRSLIAKRNEIDAKPAEVEATCKRLLQDWQRKLKAEQDEEKAKADAEAREAAKADAIADGNKRLATAIEQGKVAVASNVIAPAKTKLKGVSVRESWEANVVDKEALVKACLTGRCPLEWLQVDMKAITAVVRSSRGQMTIPGVVGRLVQNVGATRTAGGAKG